MFYARVTYDGRRHLIQAGLEEDDAIVMLKRFDTERRLCELDGREWKPPHIRKEEAKLRGELARIERERAAAAARELTWEATRERFDFRKASKTCMVDSGVSELVVNRILGHSDGVAGRYYKLSEDAARNALSTLAQVAA